MSLKRPLFFFALFCGFLLAGLSVGRQIGTWRARNQPQLPARSNQLEKQSLPRENTPDLAAQTDHQVSQPPPLPAIPPSQAPSNAIIENGEPLPRQNNILLIGVNNLDVAYPRLESTWLILYMTQTPHLTLMPIYPENPSQDENAEPPGTDLAKLFQSDPDGLPGPDFFTELKTRGLWWSGYIIVDRQALNEVIDLVGRLAEQSGEGELSPEMGILESVPSAWNNPQRAYEGQIHVAQRLCSAAAHITVDHINEIDDIFLLFTDDILSDINREGAAAELVGMLVQGSGITCEFPTLGSENP